MKFLQMIMNKFYKRKKRKNGEKREKLEKREKNLLNRERYKRNLCQISKKLLIVCILLLRLTKTQMMTVAWNLMLRSQGSKIKEEKLFKTQTKIKHWKLNTSLSFLKFKNGSKYKMGKMKLTKRMRIKMILIVIAKKRRKSIIDSLCEEHQPEQINDHQNSKYREV